MTHDLCSQSIYLNMLKRRLKWRFICNGRSLIPLRTLNTNVDLSTSKGQINMYSGDCPRRRMGSAGQWHEWSVKRRLSEGGTPERQPHSSWSKPANETSQRTTKWHRYCQFYNRASGLGSHRNQWQWEKITMKIHSGAVALTFHLKFPKDSRLQNQSCRRRNRTSCSQWDENEEPCRKPFSGTNGKLPNRLKHKLFEGSDYWPDYSSETDVKLPCVNFPLVAVYRCHCLQK